MKICNTCLKLLHCESEYFALEDETNDFISFRSKLVFCVPEMDLEVFQYSIICVSCSEVLNLAYDFKNNCLRSEQRARDSNQVNETKAFISMNLSDVDSKIDIKEIDLEESYAPFANIIIKDELPFAVAESSEDNKLYLPKSCQQVRSEENDCKTLQSDTSTNLHKFQRNFATTNNLESHVKEELHCDVCQISFSDKFHLRDHIESNITEKSFKCEDCKQDFVIKMVLGCRTNNYDEKIRAFCGWCQEDDDSPSNAYINAAENKFNCGTCQQKVSGKRQRGRPRGRGRARRSTITGRRESLQHLAREARYQERLALRGLNSVRRTWTGRQIKVKRE